MRGDYLSKPSSAPFTVNPDGKDLVWTLYVPDHGYLTIRASSDPSSGRMSYDALATLPNAPK